MIVHVHKSARILGASKVLRNKESCNRRTTKESICRESWNFSENWLSLQQLNLHWEFLNAIMSKASSLHVCTYTLGSMILTLLPKKKIYACACPFKRGNACPEAGHSTLRDTTPPD